jgi:hypothetical protein
MNQSAKWKSLRRLTLIVLLGAAIGGCASGPNTPSPALMQQIKTANSPGDHEALAKYYDGKAAEARATARTHRAMLENYQGAGTGGRGGSGSLRSQHTSIVDIYENLAVQYEGLSSEHRRMATDLKQ